MCWWSLWSHFVPLDSWRFTCRLKLSMNRKKELRLITSWLAYVSLQPIEMTTKCKRSNAHVSGVMYYYPCITQLPNMNIKLSTCICMERNLCCWLWDRNYRCCLQAQPESGTGTFPYWLCLTSKLAVFFFFNVVFCTLNVTDRLFLLYKTHQYRNCTENNDYHSNLSI